MRLLQAGIRNPEKTFAIQKNLLRETRGWSDHEVVPLLPRMLQPISRSHKRKTTNLRQSSSCHRTQS